MLTFNFRKILKFLKILIKNKKKIYFFNNKYKNFFFYKSNFIFFKFKIFKKNFFLKKNFSVLNLLENKGNILSCIRTCYIFNVYVIINRKIKSFFNNCFIIKKIIKFIFFIKKNNIIISASLKAKLILKKQISVKKFLIIIGNEKKGINFFLLRISDFIFKINSYRKKCLNVNVINSIMIYIMKYVL